MWYTGRSTAFTENPNLPFSGTTGQHLPAQNQISEWASGVVTSSDGLHWQRPSFDARKTEMTGRPLLLWQSQERASAENIALGKNEEEWWAFDTEAVSVADVQV